MSDFNESSENAAAPEPQSQKKKLTDTQLRVIQIIAGVVSAVVLMLSLYLPSLMVIKEENSLLQYAFLVVFLIIMFGRRTIENKYRLRLGLYGLVLIDGILAGILLFLLLTPQIPLDATWKLVILIGGTVLLLVLGIGWPYLRYRKRVENGTLPSVRLPEPEEPKEDEAPKEEGVSSVEKKIAAMMRELDEKEENKNQSGE